MNGNSYKLHGLDIAKFIMAVCVIAIHTKPWIHCSNVILVQMIESFVNAAVPFFFVSAGYLLQMKIKTSTIQNDIEIIKKYVQKIVRLYVMWSIIYLPLAAVEYVRKGDTILKAILCYIRDFVFVGQHYNSWILWYLLSTIYSLAIILILKKYNVSLKHIVLVGLLAFILSLFIDFVKATNNPNNYFVIKTVLKQTIGSGRILRGLFYFPFGMYLYEIKRISRISNCILYITIFMFSYIVNCFVKNETVSNILLIPCTWSLFEIVLNINIKSNSKVYSFLRKMSTEMYFIHLWIWTIYYTKIYKSKTYGWDSFLATLFVSIIISASIVVIREKKKVRMPGLPL